METVRYKLIKNYPGSPNTIGLVVHKNGNWYESNFAIESVEHFHQPIAIVEDYPEFWELIPEFKVLYFKRGDEGYRVLPDDTLIWDIPEYKNYTSNTGGTKWQEAINGNICLIYSIVRSGDNEVFTIDDEVTIEEYDVKPFRIESFLLENGKLFITGNGNYVNINRLNHYKEVLFTTEDGVDIYKGDTVHYVLPNFEFKSFTASNNKIRTEIKYFADKELAFEYIDYNKPKYSMRDIENASTARIGDKPMIFGSEGGIILSLAKLKNK